MNRILAVIMYRTNVVLPLVFKVNDIVKASLSIPTTKHYSILDDKTKNSSHLCGELFSREKLLKICTFSSMEVSSFMILQD